MFHSNRKKEIIIKNIRFEENIRDWNEMIGIWFYELPPVKLTSIKSDEKGVHAFKEKERKKVTLRGL